MNSKARRHARLSAVQALYEMEIAGKKSKLVVHEFNQHWFEVFALEGEKTDLEFFELIVLGVVAEQTNIDQAIKGKLGEKWTLARLDTTLRAILRCATFELLRLFDVPALVIIDQYVDITSGFFAAKETGFVNAALDRLARDIRPEHFGIPSNIPSA